MLKEVGTSITRFPDDFTPHRQIRKVFDARVQMLESPESLVDWAMAEALAFGTLVAEGNHVRMSGQVCKCPWLNDLFCVGSDRVKLLRPPISLHCSCT